MADTSLKIDKVPSGDVVDGKKGGMFPKISRPTLRESSLKFAPKVPVPEKKDFFSLSKNKWV
jgi:hypothetical protein